MRKLYFVSLNGIDWYNLETGDERKARNSASKRYPQGIYGAIYLGLLDGDKVRKELVRSTKVNDQRTYWHQCGSPSDMVARTLVCGSVYWLSIDGSDKRRLLSTHRRAAKQSAARDALLREGSKVEIYLQRKGEETQTLDAVGDCTAPGVIKWRKSVLDFVTNIT